jgi:hypothetical protein
MRSPYAFQGEADGGAESLASLVMPKVDFFFIIVDTLAKRYGWSYKTISEEMYWEQVWEMFELCCNREALEKNDEMKFQFMLHAQSKQALDSWKDSPIPFPNPEFAKLRLPDKTNELPKEIQRMAQVTKMTPEQRERFEYVVKMQKDAKRKAKEEYENYLVKLYKNA